MMMSQRGLRVCDEKRVQARKEQSAGKALPRCAILLAICEPNEFLESQLDSIEQQTFESIQVFVGDDSSTRQPKFASDCFSTRTHGKYNWFPGPRAGFAQNFLNLLHNVSEEFEYAAFSDQDDVWSENKIERAIEKLRNIGDSVPAAYCSRTEVCDANLNHVAFSRLPRRPLSFSNSLVQNVMAGNTIVLNRAAISNLQSTLAEIESVSAHDWWVYQVITGVGGEVIFDPEPSLKYRQHASNSIGANRGIRALCGRVRHVYCRNYARWVDQNTKALTNVANILTTENQVILEEFVTARKRRFFKRLLGLWKSGVYRHSKVEACALWIAAALGRV